MKTEAKLENLRKLAAKFLSVITEFLFFKRRLGASIQFPPSPQIFAKVDLSVIDIYREKEKIANKKKKNSLKFL